MRQKKENFYNGLNTSLLENQSMKYFVDWYVKGAKKEDFKGWQNLSENMEWALENYLKRGDVQACIVDFYKRNKDMDFIKLYRTMMDKALKGDGKSADWILKAQESDFFKTKSKSAIDNIIERLDVND